MSVRCGLRPGVFEVHVNGQFREVVLRSSDTLLHALRDLGLTGAKPGCENGDCGACTVLLDGVPVHACLTLGVEAVGHSVTTAEGLVDSPIRQAFIDYWAIQCGYCTPGFVVVCHALVTQCKEPTDEQIKEWLQPNLCRCTGYQEIKDAVHAVLSHSTQTTQGGDKE
ncbi:(2Fe-2S)-binding protein [Ferroacidibacillus organovorans]|uniref:(2Fe-2S)-binding protein n=1 Tax=Ferroacidibacillus organovorans TaxID=1765683 RepID=A0A1V4EWQ4_9BACL|nr:(2Fe-2S)-binding protein [Ferroacidibacillus organovorans]OPG17367.1 (2Fe-2S)-binding protein [Ferroacidibacillus organovorans]